MAPQGTAHIPGSCPISWLCAWLPYTRAMKSSSTGQCSCAGWEHSTTLPRECVAEEDRLSPLSANGHGCGPSPGLGLRREHDAQPQKPQGHRHLGSSYWDPMLKAAHCGVGLHSEGVGQTATQTCQVCVCARARMDFIAAWKLRQEDERFKAT